MLSASSTAAALLLTTVAASAPVSAHNSPRRACRARRGRRFQVVLEIHRRARRLRDRLDRRLREQRAAEIGVQHDPVALITGRKEGSSASIAARVRRITSSSIAWREGEPEPVTGFDKSARRSSAWARRTISLTYSRPSPSIPSTPSHARRHSSTGGIARNDSARASRPARAAAARPFFAGGNSSETRSAQNERPADRRPDAGRYSPPAHHAPRRRASRTHHFTEDHLIEKRLGSGGGNLFEGSNRLLYVEGG